jgi:AP2-associated kinase
VPEPTIVKAISDIAEGLMVMHMLKPPLQHRDLKLENVLLEDGVWKLCDFGSVTSERADLAKMPRHDKLMMFDRIEGTVTMMYRPPEMVDMYSELKIFTAVDIWMLGCVLYTLMFRTHPFLEGSSHAISQATYAVPPSSYSARLVDLMHWCLARDPADRPAARALCEILWSWSEGTAVTLPPKVQAAREAMAAKQVRADRDKDAFRPIDFKKEKRRSRASAAPAPAPASADLVDFADFAAPAVPAPFAPPAAFEPAVTTNLLDIDAFAGPPQASAKPAVSKSLLDDDDFGDFQS